jgi:hypothetical protein
MDIKPIDTSDITEENAQQVLIEQLEQAGVWQKDMRVKVAVKILFGQIVDLQMKIALALDALK